jgi:hypothetical protein
MSGMNEQDEQREKRFRLDRVPMRIPRTSDISPCRQTSYSSGLEKSCENGFLEDSRLYRYALSSLAAWSIQSKKKKNKKKKRLK